MLVNAPDLDRHQTRDWYLEGSIVIDYAQEMPEPQRGPVRVQTKRNVSYDIALQRDEINRSIRLLISPTQSVGRRVHLDDLDEILQDLTTENYI